MSRKPKRSRGAQPGNQNARIHGFYSSRLTPEEEKALPLMSGTRGLDREMDVARLRLLSAIARDPGNNKVVSMALSALVKIERIKEMVASETRRDALHAAQAMDNLAIRSRKTNHAHNMP